MRFITYDEVTAGRETFEDYVISGAISSALHHIPFDRFPEFPHVHDFIRHLVDAYGGSKEMAVLDFIRNNL